MAGTVMPPPAAAAAAGRPMSASLANSFRVAAVAERLQLHLQPGFESNATEFFSLCLSLARGIDYAVANNEVPARAQDLPFLLKQVCHRRHDLLLQAAIMVLMISVKNACKIGWFSEEVSHELLNLADEIGMSFCNRGDISTGDINSHPIIPTVMSRFYPLMKMGQILAFLEVKPGYGAYVIDFHISKNTKHSPQEKIRLFVAQIDDTNTSACVVSPPQVNFLLNGRGVDRRTNVFVDTGPQIPTNVTAMLKYGTNLLQAIGQFNGCYIIVIAFMSVVPLPDTPMLLDYVHPDVAALDPDSDIIEGPSRISLNCPISYRRIRTPVKGHSCKHLQCFDFNNYIDINSRRPSWRCSHCNQHVCYTDLRVDQNMVKVLREVGDNVADVIISADGSWKAILESDDNMDQVSEKTNNCEKEGPEQQESAPFLDLTAENDVMDVISIIESEDRKPCQSDLQSQPPAISLGMPTQLSNANAVVQNVSTDIDDGFWSGVHFIHGSVASNARSEEVVNIPPHTMPANVTSDAINSSPNGNGGHGINNFTYGMQNQISASGNLSSPFFNPVLNHEYVRLQQIPSYINRNLVAIQALPAPSPVPAAHQRLRTNLSTSALSSQTVPSMAPTGNTFNRVSNGMDRQQQFARSHMNLPQVSGNQHSITTQNWNHQGQSVVGQSVQQQIVGLPTSGQLAGVHRSSSGLPSQSSNLPQRQTPLIPQSRNPSPNVVRLSSPLARTPIQQGGAAQAGAGNTTTLNTQNSRYAFAAQRAMQMSRQPPSVPVQIQTSRTGTLLTPAVEQRRNVGVTQAATGTDGMVNSPSEQNWQPTGRMRGSLAGRAFDQYKDFMIQPTQGAQVPRPPSNLTPPTTPSSVPPHLQAFLSNSRNVRASQTQTTPTEPSNVVENLVPNHSAD